MRDNVAPLSCPNMQSQVQSFENLDTPAIAMPAGVTATPLTHHSTQSTTASRACPAARMQPASNRQFRRLRASLAEPLELQSQSQVECSVLQYAAPPRHLKGRVLIRALRPFDPGWPASHPQHCQAERSRCRPWMGSAPSRPLPSPGTRPPCATSRASAAAGRSMC